MTKRERVKLREKIDEEQRAIRQSGMRLGHHESWLKDVRQAVGIQVDAMTEKLNCHRTAIYQAEEREARKTLGVDVLEKMADAMNCHLVYAIVPNYGWTMRELAEDYERARKRERAKLEKAESKVEEIEEEDEDEPGVENVKVLKLLERIEKVIRAGEGKASRV